MTRLQDRLSAHLGYMFTERPFAERFAAARAQGFSKVEAPTPYQVLKASELREILQGEGLEYIQMALAPGDGQRGEKGIAALPARVVEFREAVLQGLDYAADVGIPFVHPMAGQVPAGQRTEAAQKTYLDNLHFTAAEAEKRGLRVLIEPFSRPTVPDYFLDSVDQAAGVVAALGLSNIAILMDVYHEAVCGRDPAQTLRRHAAVIGHLHLADCPGRNEPGTGKIDFTDLRAVIDEVGFPGSLGCEYKPAGVTEAGLNWRDGDWLQ